MAEEIRLTQEEWIILSAKRECARHGHDWNIMYNGLGLPIRMSCARPCTLGPFKIERIETPLKLTPTKPQEDG